MSIAVFGTALSLFALEANRMSSFQSVGFTQSTPSVALTVSAALLLCAFCLYLLRPTFRLHRHPAVGFIVAFAYAGTSLCLASNGLRIHLEQLGFVMLVLQSIQQTASVLLVVCWVEALVPYRAKHVAITFALALCALGGINMLSSLLKTDAARVLVAMLSFVSMACLYWFKDHGRSPDVAQSPAPANARAMQIVDSSIAPPESSAHQSIAFVLSFVIPLLFFTFAFGNVHYSWIPAQDGSFVSTSIQLAAGVGTILGGILALLFASCFWGRRKIELYLFVALPILVCALYLTAVVDPKYSFAYVVPLNIAQKLVLFVALLTPFLAPRHRPPLAALLLAVSSYQIGKILSGISQNSSNGLAYSICVIVAIMGVLACLTVALLINRTAPEASRANGTSNESTISGAGFPPETRGSKPASGQCPGNRNADSFAGPLGDKLEARLCAPGNESLPSDGTSPANAPDAFEEHLNDDGAGPDAPSMRPEAERRIAACHTVAEEYQLTRREEEVLQLLSEGMNAQAIAETLVVSTSTAKSHMRNIYAKLDVHTQNELIILVHRHMK